MHVVEQHTRIFRGAVVATCCAFLYQTDEGVHYTYTQRCDINLSLPVPKAIIHHGEKGHTQGGGAMDAGSALFSSLPTEHLASLDVIKYYQI